ncbi:Ribonuclease 3 1 [Hyella patelloides LEGE 07179]|uniref:Ribonuclease 3 n=1 Tax=Hyella patelloides LEGE 07179 TaxID=945734 RepID=A0A563VWB2_9CYAN|nr:ribonuclease III [Hyella patelloides]VEP15710.1 Ribonuclease 3 1 [Hyella patelloides LEGE 07179]
MTILCQMMQKAYSLPPISDRKLLDRALTHRSYANENPEVEGHNERLEFLGDAVLGFLVGEMLYRLYPQMNEAELTRLRSRLVDETQLSQIGAQMNLGTIMRLGNGAAKDKGRENPSLLNDTFEAIIGAYYLDAGITAVSSYIKPLFQSLAEQLVTELANSRKTSFIDSKNRFQQWALAHHKETPKYQIIAESGLDNAKEFTAQVSVKGIVYGTGKGRRKKEAEKQAAIAAWEQSSVNSYQ